MNSFRRAGLRPAGQQVGLPDARLTEDCKMYRHREPVAFSLVSGRCSVIQITVSNSFRPGIPGSGQGAQFVALTEAGATGSAPAPVTPFFNNRERAGHREPARDRSFLTCKKSG